MVQQVELAQGKAGHSLLKISSDPRSRQLPLSCSRADLTPAGCRSRRPPTGGAERAGPREDPDPWLSRSPVSEWGRGFLPLRPGSGRFDCSALRRTWGSGVSHLTDLIIFYSLWVLNVFIHLLLYPCQGHWGSSDSQTSTGEGRINPKNQPNFSCHIIIALRKINQSLFNQFYDNW